MQKSCLTKKGRKIFTVFLFFSFAENMNAQNSPLTNSFKVETVGNINALLKDNYTFPEIASKTATHLNMKVANGWLNSFPSLDSFSKALTSEIYTTSKDKHIRLRPSKMPPPARLTDIGVKGFKEAKVLDGNIGYIDIRLFVPGAETVIDSIMKTIEHTTAVIIDVRNNAGGIPEMMQYLCSYFFDERILLNSSYSRISISTREFWTTVKWQLPAYLEKRRWRMEDCAGFGEYYTLKKNEF